MNITLFVPCYIDALYPRVAMSTVAILERLGHAVDFAESLTCCGQPPFNSGYHEDARRIARPVLQRLENAEAVVIPSGSCTAMIKVFYRDLFAGQPEEATAAAVAEKCYELTDFLVRKLGITELGAAFPHRVTFHDGCHGLRELNLKSAPRELLKNVRGLELIELRDPETCCGFGGAFSTKFPMISTAMGEVKCRSAAETGADFVVSGDSSCLMHLQGLLSRQGSLVKTLHLAEILASR